ncbi:MAG: GNAT family N-acetyltransferase [Gemmatimonadetes bacterium]|nr:GNAT family N-acetyltransferase [Gemmatimonadota bacterium]NIQ57345.1 GNAT family N-acetyltransferase [Gemmatimonadota bacterium]NIU77508.1 GNAT family N-acetyltransferase [Gammaproteobacteria bacterium]NIX46716.1 GNAT family N-acetyltransferase [Gemmatimonadota bacterium]NIY11064.1 GNAT family N-acetyltransferase [Gemmatimonadota bacterium]
MSARAGVRLEFDYLTRRRSFLELGALAGSVYGGEPPAPLTNESLWRAFPRGYVGGWLDDALTGCILLWPLDARRAGDFLAGSRRERDLTEDDLVTVCNSPRAVYYFAGLLIAPSWRGRGMAAHLLAEAMVRWHRDLPWRPPIRFAAMGVSVEALRFIDRFGMERLRSAEETADGHPRYGRTFGTEAALRSVVRSARDAADRKGRLVESP